MIWVYFSIVKEMLIADSGGTKTDWCFINSEGHAFYFESESYHPINWSESFWDGCTKFWKDKSEMLNAQLEFYGAGCLNQEVARSLEAKFKQLGFREVVVQSDLHGAGKACVGDGTGTVAIMGTGSVMFRMDKGLVTEVIGGKGHLAGDEGSGYYFGKLIYEAFLQNNLTANQREIIESKIDLEYLHGMQEREDAKFVMADMASLLTDDQDAFRSFHVKNISRFLDSHVKANALKKICLIGSYAFFHADILKKEFSRRGIQIDSIIRKPIVNLVEQNVSYID
ncbi:MAG: hypothetical protein JKY09_05810 [Crocinitomicaceae bacterium]|nr:hypothetical protein [Crocinitomicaceae bacterium]